MTEQPAADPYLEGIMKKTPATPTPVLLVCSICGQDGLKSIGPTSDYDHNYTDCAAAERDRLVAVNAKLVALVKESLAFVGAWAGTYQASHGLEAIHPKHQETIDAIQAVLSEARKP